MAESFVNVTEGSGKKLHSIDRTIGVNLVHDEVVIPGETQLPAYFASYAGVSTGTVNSHMAQLMAGASLHVRIRRITLKQRNSPAGSSAVGLEIRRLTTAGTGGGSVTPRPKDSGDAASGATGMTLPTVKGSEGVVLIDTTVHLHLVAAIGPGPLYQWEQAPNSKPIIIPAGTANGICIKNSAALASATLDITIEFDETAWL